MSVAFLDAAAFAATRSSSVPGSSTGRARLIAPPGSVVTLDGVVDRGVQGAACGARGLVHQDAPGFAGERGGALAGVAETAGTFDQRGEARPLRRGPLLTPRELLQALAVGFRGLAERRDQRQRDLALGEVVAHGLPGHLGHAQVIEEVVHDLERDA